MVRLVLRKHGCLRGGGDATQGLETLELKATRTLSKRQGLEPKASKHDQQVAGPRSHSAA